MARPKKAATGKTPIEKQAENYRHPEADSPLRPEVGTQAKFRKKLPPATYRYDHSLSPALEWDGQNSARERGEAMIREIIAAKTLEEAKAAAVNLKAISKPFLNWAGKAERLSFDVPTLPLFIHERLSTKAIIETLKSHRKDAGHEQTDLLADLFADPQHAIHDQVLRAYEFRDEWVNRMILGDSLVVMNSLLRYEGLGGQVQMIYMDPPYGIKFGSNFQPFVRKRDVANGDDEDMTREPEMVKAYRDTWELGLHSYLTYLRDRLCLGHDLLHPSGSVFVQISDENLHYVVEILDEVFGPENRVGIIAFKKTGFASDDELSTTHDFIVWHAKDKKRLKMHKIFENRDLLPAELSFYDQIELRDGTRRALSKEEKLLGPKIREIGKPYARNPIVSPGWQDSLGFEISFEGQRFRPPNNRHWATAEQGMERLRSASRLAIKGNTLRFIRYFDDFAFQSLGTNWNDTGVGGFVGDDRLYVVQTDTRVIERCLLMTTDPGDLVLDPTCGSGTTAYVAEQWGRRWVTIDTSRVPLALARQRLLSSTLPWYELKDNARGPAAGFVYKRKQNKKGEEVGGVVPHITLKSIAYNEPPQDEVLVDRPETDTGIVRVSGPFVVEATIPTPVDWDGDGEEDSGIAKNAEAHSSFIARMIEVLRHSPLLHVGGGKTVALKHIRIPASTLTLSAEATVDASAEGQQPGLEDVVNEAYEKNENLLPLTRRPVAILFGPENGAISEALVNRAHDEASMKSKGYTHLYVIGFAIQPNARAYIENAAKMGIPATYVQATPDLMMGDLLKNMRSSQIFSVCGMPEIEVREIKKKKGTDAPARFEVELLGMDLFDPVTMETYHRQGEDVPAWFLDTDYNEMCFHVCQAFFPRTGAWESLKKALKATHEESVWDHLAGTVSAPFEAGERRRVAVKVIDDRGNELLAVKEIKEAKR